MAEQTFQSPGYFEREIDLSERQKAPLGIPAGVIGTAQRGPAFVPVTVGSVADFITKFGELDPDRFGPYAVIEFMKNRTACTFVRVLGAGAITSDADIDTLRTTGKVTNAGTVVTGTSATPAGGFNGAVQFIVANHVFQTNEALGMPMFTDNDSYGAANGNLVRAEVFMASDTKMLVLDGNEAVSNVIGDTGAYPNDLATLSNNEFKIVLSSSAGTAFANDDSIAGIKVYTASLNPSSDNYISKILNTNPDLFSKEKHYLHADFAVDNEVAYANTAANSIGVAHGSANVSKTAGDTTMPFRHIFGHFDGRYCPSRTPYFISQPYGVLEWDIFYVESLSDGDYGNARYKISITNVRKSTDNTSDYGTFSLQVRKFDDTDVNREVLEQFDNLTLNPLDENYIARIIGDKKVFFNFDDATEEERRLVVRGKYPNKSAHIRVVLSSDLENGNIPASALPFGFRGVETVKTNDNLTDTPRTSAAARLLCSGTTHLTGAIVPPIPFRFKCTRGSVATTGLAFAGHPGSSEIVASDLYWGTKFERNTVPLNANVTQESNTILAGYSVYSGLKLLDAVVTGSGKDTFNNNKFTLAKVALNTTAINNLTASANEHMLDTAYIRNSTPDPTEYKVDDGTLSGRITLGTLVSLTSSFDFNKFIRFNKFSTFMYGGWDGTNIIDKNARRLNDRATSIETLGGAASSFTSPGLATNVAGSGLKNNAIASYRAAINMMTDKYVVNSNLLIIPGIREPFVTDHAADRVKSYGMAMYVMDIPNYDENSARIFDDQSTKPSVEKTINLLDGRSFDSNYVATYFPDVSLDDEFNNRRVMVPASIAALAALGFNDKVAYPWFAPAGFNRGALDFVKNANVRLSTDDRNDLYDARINPIASLPRTGFVIFGQKTMQQAKSALDRVNVRRLVVEVKRIIVGIAENIVFEQNVPETRQLFTKQAILQLGIIQAQTGIKSFSVIMNESNNTEKDADEYKLNGRITIVPTRAIEFISMDFIITSAGVEFI